MAHLSDLRRNNPKFASMLHQRLEEEEKAIEYAKLLLVEHGKYVQESSARIYINPSSESFTMAKRHTKSIRRKTF
jgi:hypothetical protein